MPQSRPMPVNSCLRSRIVILLAGLLAACSYTGIGAISQADSAKKPMLAVSNVPVTKPAITINEAQTQEIGLQLTAAKHGFVHKTVEAPGQVQPNAELSTLVSTPSAGRAIKVLAKLGDTVKTGQIMAVIKSDPIGQVQSDLLQNVLQANSDIKQQEVALELDHITFDRESILFKEQVSAKADLQAAENALKKDQELLYALQRKRQAYLIVAQERLTLLGAPPDSAQKVVDTKKLDPWVIVRAPRSGLVIERTVNPGELNDGTKQLFTLADLSEVWLVANVFEKDVQSIKKGQGAYVTLDSLPDHKFPAKIVWVGDTMNATTRTLPVRANVANPQLILKPNMFARIKVNVGSVSVLLVPRAAVMQRGDKTLVFVKSGEGKYQEREVTTGVEDADDIQILAGLKPGELVVSHGGTAILGAAIREELDGK